MIALVIAVLVAGSARAELPEWVSGKALIDQYGVHFDPAVRDQVVTRFKSLDLPTYWAGVNVEVTANVDATGAAKNVQATPPRDAVRQYLNYGRMFDPGLPVIK